MVVTITFKRYLLFFNKTITSFFSDQTIFEESSLQFDHELDEWSKANETLQISFDYAKIM